jgi:predicted house-cleaning noncanonical NTP pyrophosphatase (MazG superfamily)
MRKEYNKLVRDRIPEIIARDDREYEVVTMSEPEYREALRKKLVEEAEEVAAADHEKLKTELADVYEIMDALMSAYGIDRETVLAEQERRRAERGGFAKRIQLLWTE